MLFDATSALANFERNIARQIEELKLTIFVCGPSIRDSTGALSQESGAVVRNYVSEQLNREGHRCIWGEHLPSKGGGSKVAEIRRLNNADKEILLAVHDDTDLIVIFPSSAGSIAELGAFCMHDKISCKLLIIFDAKYRGDQGFVVKAVGKAAKNRKAVIKYEDYQSPGKVWTLVRGAVGKQRELKTLRLSHV